MKDFKKVEIMGATFAVVNRDGTDVKLRVIDSGKTDLKVDSLKNISSKKLAFYEKQQALRESLRNKDK